MVQGMVINASIYIKLFECVSTKELLAELLRKAIEPAKRVMLQ